MLGEGPGVNAVIIGPGGEWVFDFFYAFRVHVDCVNEIPMINTFFFLQCTSILNHVPVKCTEAALHPECGARVNHTGFGPRSTFGSF